MNLISDLSYMEGLYLLNKISLEELSDENILGALIAELIDEDYIEVSTKENNNINNDIDLEIIKEPNCEELQAFGQRNILKSIKEDSVFKFLTIYQNPELIKQGLIKHKLYESNISEQSRQSLMIEDNIIPTQKLDEILIELKEKHKHYSSSEIDFNLSPLRYSFPSLIDKRKDPYFKIITKVREIKESQINNITLVGLVSGYIN